MVTERKGRVLIIEDDPQAARLQQRCLECAGFEALTAQTAAGGMRRIRLGGIDLLVLDYKLPELDGLEVYERIKQAGQDVPVILVTDFSDEATALKAMRAGVRDFVTRSPEYLDHLPHAIERVLSQVRLERQFAYSEARLAGIINSVMDAIITIDCDRTITLFNPAAEKMFRCSAAQVLGGAIDQFIPAAGSEEFYPPGQSGSEGLPSMNRSDLFGMRADGDKFPLEVSISSAEMDRRKFSVLVVRDITQRKQAEWQSLRAERMEAIASLAGGIAHDLNNVFTPLIMGVELLEAFVPKEVQESLLGHMRRSAERGADVVKQILSIAKNMDGKNAELQLKHVMTDVLSMLQDSLPKSIRLQTSLPEDLWAVVGDAGPITQGIMGLCFHATDFMPLEGRLTLSAENVIFDKSHIAGRVGARVGPYVRFIIAGIRNGGSAESSATISVKKKDKQSERNLVIALSLVKGDSGFVDVASETENGTIFRIYLPAAEIKRVEQGKDAANAPLHGSGDLILVVDDEASIRELTKAILEAHGYRALSASSGSEAVAIYEQHGKAIRGVLVDMIMPVMDGLATIRALRKLDPQVQIMAMSGLAAEGETAESAELDVEVFLPKPYRTDMLLTSLRELLRGKSAQNGKPHRQVNCLTLAST